MNQARAFGVEGQTPHRKHQRRACAPCDREREKVTWREPSARSDQGGCGTSSDCGLLVFRVYFKGLSFVPAAVGSSGEL